MKPTEPVASISLVQAADLGAAVNLLTRQLEEHHIPTSAVVLGEIVQKVIAAPKYGFLLLATIHNREPVGIAYVAAHLSAEHGGTIGWLEELYVAPEFRCRGIGSMLLDEVVARAQHAGWQGLDLEVVAGHERASAVYIRRGFQPADRQRYHYDLTSNEN